MLLIATLKIQIVFQGGKRKGGPAKSVSVMKKPVPQKRKFKGVDEEIHSDSDDEAG